jgi:hypothetical protein
MQDGCEGPGHEAPLVLDRDEYAHVSNSLGQLMASEPAVYLERPGENGEMPALTSHTFAEVPVTPLSVSNRTFSYRRWEAGQRGRQFRRELPERRQPSRDRRLRCTATPHAGLQPTLRGLVAGQRDAFYDPVAAEPVQEECHDSRRSGIDCQLSRECQSPVA